MFGNAINLLCCPYCGSRGYSMDPAPTVKSYSDPRVFKLEDVERIVDGCIAEYTVFVCLECGAEDKLTIRDIEKTIRKEMTKRVLTAVASNEILNSVSVRVPVYMYCGKCTGFDGKGSCSLDIYKKCEIKRFPSGL